MRPLSRRRVLAERVALGAVGDVACEALRDTADRLCRAQSGLAVNVDDMDARAGLRHAARDPWPMPTLHP